MNINALKRIGRNLLKTSDKGIISWPTSETTIDYYVDVDFQNYGAKKPTIMKIASEAKPGMSYVLETALFFLVYLSPRRNRSQYNGS